VNETRTSACVDCETPIIGDRLRCPACHEDHAKSMSKASFARVLVAWVVIAEILVVVGCGLALVVKGCTP